MASGYVYTLDEVINLIQEYGFEYVDGYIKSDKPMTVKDTEGYLYYTTLQVIKKHNSAGKFSARNPHTVYNIQKWILEKIKYHY